MCETTARTFWSRSRSRTDKPIEATLELWASSLREVKTQMRSLDAAFVNAISANLLDYDDTHLDTIIIRPHRSPRHCWRWRNSAASPAPRCCMPSYSVSRSNAGTLSKCLWSDLGSVDRSWHRLGSTLVGRQPKRETGTVSATRYPPTFFRERACSEPAWSVPSCGASFVGAQPRH